MNINMVCEFLALVTTSTLYSKSLIEHYSKGSSATNDLLCDYEVTIGE